MKFGPVEINIKFVNRLDGGILFAFSKRVKT